MRSNFENRKQVYNLVHERAEAQKLQADAQHS
jgi:hypothetical protein